MIPTAFRDGLKKTVDTGVGAAIQQAAASTGVDFGYLLGQAKIESGLNPNAKARTSSATGLFQFIEQTWLATIEKHGSNHGLGWAADAIQRGKDGRYHVSDPAMRQQILDMRKDPHAAASMAAEFASDNRDYLERKLGRSVDGTDLYLAHFLGPAGAAKFLGAHDANPDGPAAVILPAAARANRSIFYDKQGGFRSLAAIRDRFAAKLGASGSTPMPSVPDAPKPLPDIHYASYEVPNYEAASENIMRPSPHYARLAYLMLAQMGA